jgi:hypothetical protein
VSATPSRCNRSRAENTLPVATYRFGETEKANRSLDIGVDRFKTAPCRIEFVPEAGPPGVLQKLLPPFTMGFCPCEAFKRFKIAPVLAHPDMQRKQRIEDILVKKQGPCCGEDDPPVDSAR